MQERYNLIQDFLFDFSNNSISYSCKIHYIFNIPSINWQKKH